MRHSFAALILTHGRPHNVVTYKALRKYGYTGKIYIVVDNEDKTINDYKNKYKNVIVFDKEKEAKRLNAADNFNDRRTIVYARNASFEIAKQIGVDYFIQLDDDYTQFSYRQNSDFNYIHANIKNLDEVFDCMVDLLEDTGAASVAMAQGGDFVGGSDGGFAKSFTLKRKAMNTFVCSTAKPFQFVGRVNEDVNTYTHEASKGLLFFTITGLSINQKQTQSNPGGMTEMYLDSGTYVKSFYTVIFQPSSVVVGVLNGGKEARLHHRINWECTVPKIIRENCKKG